MRARGLGLLLAVLSVCGAASARTPAAHADPFEGFDAVLERTIADFKVPGLAVCVVEDGRVVYRRGVGMRDVARKLPVTPDTVFTIASCSKAFTTFVLGTLVDEGKLDWDAPVSSVLPEFRMYDPAATATVTPRDLVTHRTGLPRHDMLWYNNLTLSRRELVERMRYLEPSAAPRAKWQYNNLGYVAAGYLAERITGKTWERNVQERVLDPLGMTRTNFSVLDSQSSDDFAKPYVEKDGALVEVPFRRVTTIGPAGSVDSTANDLAKWVALQLGDGTVEGRRLISAATLAELHRPQIATDYAAERPDVSAQSYALGWFAYDYRGHELVEHGGNLDGFTALVTLLPKDGLGVVVLANKDSTNVPTIVARHAIDRALGLSPVAWASEARERREKGLADAETARARKTSVRRPGTAPAHALGEYVGTYEHPGYGTLAVALEDGHLEMTYNGISAPLEHWHYETFDCGRDPKDPAFENLKLTFETDVRGDVAGVASALEPAVKDVVFERRPDARLSDPAYLATLVGDYEYHGTPVKVVRDGDGLVVAISGGPTFHLVPTLGGAYRLAEDSTITCAFVADATGAVTRIDVSRPSGVFTANRVRPCSPCPP